MSEDNNAPTPMTDEKNMLEGDGTGSIVNSDDLSAEDLYGLYLYHHNDFQRNGGLEGIHKAIETIARAIDQIPDTHPKLPTLLNDLGMYYSTRFQHLGEIKDIEQAIVHQSRVVALAPEGHAYMPLFLTNLGIFYSDRFDRLGTLDDFAKAIECGTKAVDLTSDDHPDLPGRLSRLGMLYHAQFERLGEPSDIDQAIEHLSRAVSLVPKGYTYLPIYFRCLALCSFERYDCLGTLDGLAKSIEYQTQVVELTPVGHPDLPQRLSDLGSYYRIQFEGKGAPSDIDQAIEHLSRAVVLAPEGHTDLPEFLTNLGTGYYVQFNNLRTPDSLVKSIEHQTRAVDLTPNNDPKLLMRLNDLGLYHRLRFENLGALHDIEQAIEHMSRMVSLIPENHTDLPTCLTNLGAVYHRRFDRLDTLDDLVKAVEYGVRALDLTSADNPDLLRRLSDLGISYCTRFERLGELSDIEQAIEHMSRAVALAPEGHPDLPTCLANLGVGYFNRFDRLGALDDLAMSIDQHTQAVELTPDGHPDLASRLSNLGGVYRAVFQRLGVPSDIEQAIEHLSHAVALTPEGHTQLPLFLSNLGLCYSNRFDQLGILDDLARSIESNTRAVELTPDNHPDLPMRLNNLGLSYTARFHRLGEPGDSEQAIEHLSRAVVLTPNEHPILSQHYANLAIACLNRYQRTRNPSHLQYSFECFRKGCQLPTGPPHNRFRYAVKWAALAFTHNSFDCMEAYRTTIDLLPQFIWLGASTNQRYLDLITAKNLAADAARASITHSDLGSALEWLEHARCVVWSQSLMLQSPLELLHASYPGLATRLQAVSKQLQGVTSNASAVPTFMLGSDSSEQIARQRRGLAAEYNKLLAEARTLPRFEDFLRPTKAEGLIRVPRTGPVVVINCHEQRCDALIISLGQDSITHLPLPEYNHEKASAARSEMLVSIRRQGLRERGCKVRVPPDFKDCFTTLLLDLWRFVVKPVLDFLGFEKKAPPENVPHITWCPTGAMTFLPLHAAGDYEQTQSYIFDYAISSYTPTLTALLQSVPSELPRTPRVLAIGQAKTPGRAPLPGTTKELEHVKGHTQGKAGYTQLAGNQATTENVLDAMEQHDWLHLACHAHQNVSDPTKSGFFLHDGTLSLASINRRSLKNKGLAYLSACQTATGDEELPDEAIHLASGMLMAGYSSVIATMWSVKDVDAPFVADKVYAELMKDGKVGNGEAGKALHLAVSALREKVGIREFARWVPYIHIGS